MSPLQAPHPRPLQPPPWSCPWYLVTVAATDAALFSAPVGAVAPIVSANFDRSFPGGCHRAADEVRGAASGSSPGGLHETLSGLNGLNSLAGHQGAATGDTYPRDAHGPPPPRHLLRFRRFIHQYHNHHLFFAGSMGADNPAEHEGLKTCNHY